MSVINTNITSLIAQSNLNKSQQMLSTAMERLSSGMRINSAKDDAAGQAIANRMTSQITGLNQAQRNANDGISVAQTAEGALNQVNDNLQRIRELSVQAANETNSSDDLQSIQDEISQRLGEIDRISRETDFNGVKVLAEDRANFKVQVGANDGEVINIGLEEITSQTMRVDQLDVRSMTFSEHLSEVDDEVSLLGLTEKDSITDAQWEDLKFVQQTGDVDLSVVGSNPSAGAVAAGLAANTLIAQTNGNYYQATYDADTNTVTLDSEITVATASVTANTVDWATGTDFLDDDGNLTNYANASGAAVAGLQIDVGELFQLNFSGGTGAGTTEYYVSNTAGDMYYSATVDMETGVVTVDTTSSAAGTGGDPLSGLDSVTSATLAASAGTAVTGGALLAEAGTAVDLSAVDTALNNVGTNTLYEAGDSYVVGNDDGAGNTTFYAATLDETTGAVTLSDLDTDGNPVAVATMDDAIADAGLTGTNTLMENTRVSGNAPEYLVRNEVTDSDGNVTTTYYAAAFDEDTGAFSLVLDENNELSETVVDPLATLDRALAQVDSLRSDLGAIQNRFQDAITNLNTNETNLQDARSRIEDADYAKEVAEMTRAQILQQAGTSVLAQANQLPQNVLSLLG